MTQESASSIYWAHQAHAISSEGGSSETPLRNQDPLGSGDDLARVRVQSNDFANKVPSNDEGELSLTAVCSIGLRLPGGVKSPDDFWDLLVNGKDARMEIPSSRYNIDGFDDSLDGKGVIKSRYGYFLENDLGCIDASCFSMTKQELENCDPQQPQLLEVVKETFDDAGETSYRGQPIGCYVGTFCEDWQQIANKETQHPPGNGDLMIANRVSYEYDLNGPRFVNPSFGVLGFCFRLTRPIA